MALNYPSNIERTDVGHYITGTSGSYGTARRVKLTWAYDTTGSATPVTFRILFQPTNGGGVVDKGTTTSLEFLVTGLALNVSGQFFVQAEKAGESSRLTGGPFIDAGTVPLSSDVVPPVANLVAAVVTESSVLFTWQYASDNTTDVSVTSVSADGGATPAAALANPLDKSLLLGGLTAGKSYTFTVVATSSYAVTTSTIQTHQQAGVQAFAIMAEADDTAPISGPTVLYLDRGAPASGEWAFIGAGAVLSADSWRLSTNNANLSLQGVGAGFRLAQLSGEPAQAGIFQAVVHCRRAIGLSRATFSYPVRVIVSSPGLGGCLGWLHDDPTRVDLQPDVQTRTVHSFASHEANNTEASLRLTRGDTQRIHVIPRDSGGNLITVALTKLGLTLRLLDRRDGAPLVYVPFADPAFESIAGHSVAYLDLTPASPLLDALFTALNSGPGADLAASALQCDAQLVWKIGTQPIRSSRVFACEITQDIDR